MVPPTALTDFVNGLISVEGNMCGTVMRGAVAPPGSKTTASRLKEQEVVDGELAGIDIVQV